MTTNPPAPATIAQSGALGPVYPPGPRTWTVHLTVGTHDLVEEERHDRYGYGLQLGTVDELESEDW